MISMNHIISIVLLILILLLIIAGIWSSKMDELKLFHKCSHNAENEIAVLYFLHGLDDHFGRWDNLRDFLLNRNISFYAHDQRGHGKTELGVRVSNDKPEQIMKIDTKMNTSVLIWRLCVACFIKN